VGSCSCSYRNSIAKALFLVKGGALIVILRDRSWSVYNRQAVVPEGYINCRADSESWMHMSRVVGIKEVAERAGVSITTVSHALNGKGRISPETRKRVYEIAELLGYQPNATARHLAGGRSGLIGLSVAQTGEGNFAVSDFAYFAELISAASVAALDRGYALMLASAAQVEAWSRIPVDGAIIVDPVIDDPLLESLERGGAPVVTAGRVPGRDGGWWVDSDHRVATRAILDHLAARGARRIALLGSPPTTSYSIDSREAYEQWCSEHGQETVNMVAREDLTEGSGFEATVKLLRRARPPDAVHSTLDRLALGALLAAQSRGLSVPHDLMVTGVADSEASKWARPGLTTLELYPSQIGDAAVKILTALIEGREPPESQVYVPHRIMARGSTRRRVVSSVRRVA
jgi:DNA-binding LacI/PurR family transcriptional regulator